MAREDADAHGRHDPRARAIVLLCVALLSRSGAAAAPSVQLSAPRPLFSRMAKSGRATRNMTLYRVTPVKLRGVADRNTGDAAGDVFFTLYEAILPIYCPENPSDSICNITSSVLGDTARNVYRQSLVEVDEAFGVYNGCNPQANGTVQCGAYERNMCWQNASCGSKSHEHHANWSGAIGPFCKATEAASDKAAAAWVKSFDGICDRSQCSCPAATSEAVGMWPCVFCYPEDGPKHAQTPLWNQINEMCSTLNGNWFSTRAVGECAAGQSPGDGRCFWREHTVLRNANATCVRANFLEAIRRRNSGCYDACAQPRNSSTPCYVHCMLDTITGAGGAEAQAAGPMTRAELLKPFLASFESEDPAQGGCPEVPVVQE